MLGPAPVAEATQKDCAAGAADGSSPARAVVESLKGSTSKSATSSWPTPLRYAATSAAGPMPTNTAVPGVFDSKSIRTSPRKSLM